MEVDGSSNFALLMRVRGLQEVAEVVEWGCSISVR